MLEETSSDLVLYNLEKKHLLVDFIEQFRWYLDEVTVKLYGTESRYLTLTSVDFINKVGRNGLELVTAKYQSDVGILEIILAIKEFSSSEEAENNYIMTELLQKRLKRKNIEKEKQLKVATPRIIFQKGNTLVYEGIKSNSFNETTLPWDVKNYLAGQALAKYHGIIFKSISPLRYSHLLNSTLKQLPIDNDFKKQYIQLASNLLEQLPVYYTGTASFGDFHEENILFSINENTNKIIVWLIDPEYVEQLSKKNRADRMEDIATFFLNRAIETFSRDGNLNEMQRDKNAFFDGYNNYLEIYGKSLEILYENKQEKSFLFHLGLNALLEALFILRMGKNIPKEELDRSFIALKLAIFTWNEFHSF